jgi:hypothetical protein
MSSVHVSRERIDLRAPVHRRPRHVLATLELTTGAMAAIGGVLVAAAPDGSLLAADTSALAGSPFRDYLWPGILLATLVGGGYLLTGFWQWRGGRGARALSIVAGVGLVAFEASEVLWLGFQPLELVFGLVGIAVVTMAVSARRPLSGDTAGLR